MSSTTATLKYTWPSLMNLRQVCDYLAELDQEISPSSFLVMAEQHQLSVWLEVRALHVVLASPWARRGMLVSEKQYSGFVRVQPQAHDWHVARTSPKISLAANTVFINGREWQPLMPHALMGEPVYYDVTCMLFERKQLENLVSVVEGLNTQLQAPQADSSSGEAPLPESQRDMSGNEATPDVVAGSRLILREGKNARAKVSAWVKSVAPEIKHEGDTSRALADRIVSTARRNRYESERGPITQQMVLKMLPTGITGSRGRRVNTQNFNSAQN